jgi:hypothetical protein
MPSENGKKGDLAEVTELVYVAIESRLAHDK